MNFKNYDKNIEQSQNSRRERKKRRKKYVLVKRLFVFVICIVVFLFAITVFYNLNLSSEDDSTPQNSQLKESSEYKIEDKGNTPPKSNKKQISDWDLVFVNEYNPIPPNYDINLAEFDDGTGEKHYIDERIYKYLLELFDAAKKEKINLSINSAYRSTERQTELFQLSIDELIGKGFSRKEAEKETLTKIAKPGTSEHETGLAIDFGFLGSSTWDTAYGWLEENSYKYGFVLRYPEGKQEITGVVYEPWHFRYVGKKVAKEIMEQGITLEEYLN